jgi:hypothetical protein
MKFSSIMGFKGHALLVCSFHFRKERITLAISAERENTKDFPENGPLLGIDDGG